jgi:hypothetical protein
VLGPAVIGPVARNGRMWTIPVDSAVQHGRTLVRVALPATGAPRAVALVLPVQANLRSTYGDGLHEVLRYPIADTHRMAVAAPTFTDSPWGVDHISDPRLPHALDELTRLATWPR